MFTILTQAHLLHLIRLQQREGGWMEEGGGEDMGERERETKDRGSGYIGKEGGIHACMYSPHLVEAG